MVESTTETEEHDPQTQHRRLIGLWYSLPVRMPMVTEDVTPEAELRMQIILAERQRRQQRYMQEMQHCIGLAPVSDEFKWFIVREFGEIALRGILSDDVEAENRAFFQEFFGDRPDSKQRSEPLYDVLDIGNPNTGGIFDSSTAPILEARGYRYWSGLMTILRMVHEEVYGTGTYAQMPVVVEDDLIGRMQRWNRMYRDRYGNEP